MLKTINEEFSLQASLNMIKSTKSVNRKLIVIIKDLLSLAHYFSFTLLYAFPHISSLSFSFFIVKQAVLFSNNIL